MKLKCIYFRACFFLLIMMNLLLLTACGGGGGNGSNIDISSALVGTWYLNYEDGIPVLGNSKGDVDAVTFSSDGTFSFVGYDIYNVTSSYKRTVEAQLPSYSMKGSWLYSDGSLRLSSDIDDNTELPMAVSASLDNGTLTIIDIDSETQEKSVLMLKKGKLVIDEASLLANGLKKTDFVGIWALLSVDYLPVMKNSDGMVPIYSLKSDGTAEIMHYDVYKKASYLQTGEVLQILNGNWEYSNEKLYIIFGSEQVVLRVGLVDKALTLVYYDKNIIPEVNTFKKID